MNKRKIKNNLKEIGFSQYEADVYLALLETGITSVGDIIKQTGLHRNIVYSTMEKLSDKKLVIESNKRGIKYFKVSNIERIVKEKERNLLLAQNILPELANIKNSEGVEVMIYEGIDGFQTAHKEAMEQMPKDKMIYVLMAGGAKFYEFMGDEIKNFDKIRNKNNNKIKILASRGRIGELDNQRTKKREDVVVRYLPMSLINPIGSSIYGEKTLLFVFTEVPIIIAIDSKGVAKAHIDQFKLLWKNANKK